MPAAVMGDMCVCVGPPDTIIMGSTGVFFGKMPAARMGDPTAHGGSIVLGCPTVLIGETSSGIGSAVQSQMIALAPANMVTNLMQQKVLTEAAETGAPFCEICA
jgi:hypothetical protein